MFGIGFIKKMMRNKNISKPFEKSIDFVLEYQEVSDQIAVELPSKINFKKHQFSKPKIFMVDIPQSDCLTIGEKWLDVSYGSLGQVFKVRKGSGWQKLVECHTIHGHEEADIVVIDLSLRGFSKDPAPESLIPDEHRDIWAKLDYGYLDPRFLGSVRLQEDLDRVVRSGGICVIFADKNSPIEVNYGRLVRDKVMMDAAVSKNIWSMLSAFQFFQITADQGESIKVVDDSPLGLLLKKYLDGARHTCILDCGYYREKWTVLAESKFQHPVAVVGNDADGMILIVPQLKEKISFLDELLSSVLPEMVPHLFPEVEKRSWVRGEEYELPRISELEAQKKIIKKNAEDEVARLTDEIENYRLEQGWIHDLLDGTGDQLVWAVKKALEEIGFQRVIDMDVVRDAESKPRREDLRIEDRSPLLVVDIKGVGGAPSDSDSTQADKHAMINMKEMARTDVQGLSIINHYRHLPPLSRDQQAFRQEIIDVSNETGLGLMTSFDLYKLLNGMRKHSWPSKCVMDVFYGKGRIKVLPSHYEEVGSIGKVFSGLIGVHITQGFVNIGDKLALEAGMVYDEATIASIKVENESVTTATAGDRAGFVWPITNLKPRVGMLVYRVPAESNASVH